MHRSPPDFTESPGLPADLQAVTLAELRLRRDRIADAILADWPAQVFRIESVCVQDALARECRDRILSDMGDLVVFYSDAVLKLSRVSLEIAMRERAEVLLLQRLAA